MEAVMMVDFEGNREGGGTLKELVQTCIEKEGRKECKGCLFLLNKREDEKENICDLVRCRFREKNNRHSAE